MDILKNLHDLRSVLKDKSGNADLVSALLRRLLRRASPAQVDLLARVGIRVEPASFIDVLIRGKEVNR